MKYKITPLNIIALISFCYGLYFGYEISKHNGVGLAGLVPYFFIGAAIAALVVDLGFQLVIKNNRVWLYVSEFTLFLIAAFIFYKSENNATLVISDKKPQYIRLIYNVTDQPRLGPRLFEMNYDIEVPWYGTILTSTAIEDDNAEVRFRWRDGGHVTNWTLISIERNGEFYCKEYDKIINYRLWYLSNTNNWEKDESWVETADADFETVKELLDQCQPPDGQEN